MYANIIQIFSILWLVKSESDFHFEKDYVGVKFAPYVKNLEGNAYPAFDNYTVDEIETMLLLVSSKFRTVSTDEMGTTKRNQLWKDGDAVGFTGIAAANLNRKKSSTVIQVVLGVHRCRKNYLLESEINKALSVAKEAHSIHADTIWGVTFTDGYVTDNKTVYEVLDMINSAKRLMGNESNSLKYGVGLGSSMCTLVANAYANAEAVLSKREILKMLIKSVDYIYCGVLPNKDNANRGAHYAATDIMNTLDKIRSEMQLINPEIIVIGKTGWPSSGIHTDMPPSTLNMVNYWKEISKIVSVKKFNIHMYDAMD